MLVDVLREPRNELDRLLAPARAWRAGQLRRGPAHDRVDHRRLRLRGRLAFRDRRGGEVRVSHFDLLAAALDQADRSRSERSVERVDLAARESEPLLDRRHEGVHVSVDVRSDVPGVVHRQDQLVAAHGSLRWVQRELARPEAEDVRFALERDVHNDAVAGEPPRGSRVAEVPAPVPGDVELDLLDLVPIHLIELQDGAGHGERLRERVSPLLRVGLQQMLVGGAFDLRFQLAVPRGERVAEVAAAVEEEVVRRHPHEDRWAAARTRRARPLRKRAARARCGGSCRS